MCSRRECGQGPRVELYAGHLLPALMLFGLGSSAIAQGGAARRSRMPRRPKIRTRDQLRTAQGCLCPSLRRRRSAHRARPRPQPSCTSRDGKRWRYPYLHHALTPRLSSIPKRGGLKYPALTLTTCIDSFTSTYWRPELARAMPWKGSPRAGSGACTAREGKHWRHPCSSMYSRGGCSKGGGWSTQGLRIDY
jgi:hypothetical protein